MLEKKIYYINGKWIKSHEAKIPFNDAGFLYGDGLFETLRFDNKKLFSANKHIKRILSGLKLIKLNHNFNPDSLLLLLQKIIKKKLTQKWNNSNNDNQRRFVKKKNNTKYIYKYKIFL